MASRGSRYSIGVYFCDCTVVQALIAHITVPDEILLPIIKRYHAMGVPATQMVQYIKDQVGEQYTIRSVDCLHCFQYFD